MALQFQELIDRRRDPEARRSGPARLRQPGADQPDDGAHWLAPDIQEAILRLPQMPGGRFPISEGTLRKVARLPLWEDQRARWYPEPTDGRTLS